MIDTGAALTSSAGWNQYLALCREQGVTLDTSKANTAKFKFGIGVAMSKGTVAVHSPIGMITFHVIDADTPFLLSLKDLDATGYYFNNLKNRLVGGDTEIPIVRLYGHPF